MTSTTVKKPTAAKKPATKKVAVAKEIAADKPQFGDKFEAFRKRAGDAAGLAVNEEPYVLSVEDGFSEEIVFERPSFATRLAIEAAMERNSAISALQIIFGDNLGTVIAELTEYEEETGHEPEAVISGIVAAYLEHFFGKGAREVFTKLSTL